MRRAFGTKSRTLFCRGRIVGEDEKVHLLVQGSLNADYRRAVKTAQYTMKYDSTWLEVIAPPNMYGDRQIAAFDPLQHGGTCLTKRLARRKPVPQLLGDRGKIAFVPHKRQLSRCSTSQDVVYSTDITLGREEMAADFCETKRYGSLADRSIADKPCWSVAIKPAALTDGRRAER